MKSLRRRNQISRAQQSSRTRRHFNMLENWWAESSPVEMCTDRRPSKKNLSIVLMPLPITACGSTGRTRRLSICTTSRSTAPLYSGSSDLRCRLNCLTQKVWNFKTNAGNCGHLTRHVLSPLKWINFKPINFCKEHIGYATVDNETYCVLIVIYIIWSNIMGNRKFRSSFKCTILRTVECASPKFTRSHNAPLS